MIAGGARYLAGRAIISFLGEDTDGRGAWIWHACGVPLKSLRGFAGARNDCGKALLPIPGQQTQTPHALALTETLRHGLAP